MSEHYDAGDQNFDGPPPGRQPEPRCTETLDMFAAFSRSGDPATSRDAASAVNVRQREAEVLAALTGLGGEATTTEIAEFGGLDKWSVSPRMKPLEGKGLVERTDKRHNRQIVWRSIPPK